MASPRSGSAIWKGDLPSGEGNLTVGDGVFEGAYTFKSRFEEGEGTNPEELIAAAHAACFAMAFSNMLAENGPRRTRSRRPRGSSSRRSTARRRSRAST